MATIGNLFSNPDFLKALAGFGASLDPQGLGGRLGSAAHEMIESNAMRTATRSIDEEEKKSNEELRGLLDMMTPRGEVGISSLKTSPQGNIVGEVDFTPAIGDTPRTPARQLSVQDLIPFMAPRRGISPEALRGLNPQQLQAVNAMAAQRSAERSRSVGDIANALAQQQAQRSRELADEVARLNIKRLEAEAPYVAPQADVAYRTAQENLEYQRLQRPGALRQQEASISSTEESTAATRQGRLQREETFALEKPLREYNATLFKFELPDGQELQIPGERLGTYLLDTQKVLDTEENRKAMIETKRQELALKRRDEAAERKKDAISAETALLDPTKAKINSPRIDAFNMNSDEPNMWIEYIIPPGRVGRFLGSEGTTTKKKFPIPKLSDGRQMRAFEVYEDALRHGITPKEYLEQIYASIGKKAPWLP